MGTKIFAALTMILILGFVIVNDITISNDIEKLFELVEKSETYTEAEAAAANVLSLMREGKRCRDIVVIMRN